MKAVILSAGEGKRLKPITDKIPKVMVPINGKPLLLWHIQHLKKYGIREIFINLFYLGEIIRDYFQDGSRLGVKIVYSHEKKLLGTGGALVNFKNYLDDKFVLLYGDVFTNLNLAKMEQFHIQKQAIVTIAVRSTDHPQDSDLVKIDEKQRVVNLYFKPYKFKLDTDIGLAAIYIVEPVILQYLPSRSPIDFAKDVLPTILKKEERVFCYHTNELIKDIGTLDRYRQINNLFDKQ